MTEGHPAEPDVPRGAGGALDLGSILLETTSLSETQLAEAQQRRAETGQRLTDLLVAAGWVSSMARLTIITSTGRQWLPLVSILTALTF